MSAATARVFNSCRALLAPASAARSSAAAAAKSPVKSTQKLKKQAQATKPAKPKTVGNTGIFKLSPISPALAQFLGARETSRSDAVKQIWSYIKTHNLQNPNDKKEIFCDEKLKAIFDGKEKVTFLEVAKLVSGHFVKTA